MATQPPFPFLDRVVDRITAAIQPPPWFVRESQRRIVLMLNHVLLQEPEAQVRLARHQGSVVEAHWRQFHMRLLTTPAGLLDLAEPGQAADLTLTLVDDSPWTLAQSALRGDKPQVRIAGDVQFAAEINWIVDHVRWDLEEDLARLMGDAPAHMVSQAVRGMVDGLRRFVASAPATPPAGPAR